jgi:hypothetical protein
MNGPLRPVRFGRVVLVAGIVAAGILAAACGSAAEEETAFGEPLANTVARHDDADGAPHVHLQPEEITAALSVALVPSELVVGPSRFAVGLFDSEGSLILDATVHFHYFDITDRENAVLESEADAERIVAPDGLTVIFAHDREFNRVGEWGLRVEARFPDGGAASHSIGFRVAEDTPTLGPGEVAPALETPTLDDVDGEITLLTSAESPNPELHRLSLAEALDNDNPTVLLFATPAFCETRFCGPVYDMVSEVQPRYADRVNFVYAEALSGLPDPALAGFQPSPAMTAFGLESEPWLFFIDADGKIVYRLEGLWTVDEIERYLGSRLGV